jgi:hypothetical protein
MKKHAVTLLILMLAGVTGVVDAQVVHPKITAGVPFEFIANGKMMPAGECTIKVQGDGPKILWITSGNETLVAIPHATQSQNVSKDTVLVFHRYGDRYFLASIFSRGEKFGYAFPVNKLESELRAESVLESDVVLLAALH